MKTYEKVYGVKRMCVSHLGAIQILGIPFFQAQDAVGSRLCCHRLRLPENLNTVAEETMNMNSFWVPTVEVVELSKPKNIRLEWSTPSFEDTDSNFKEQKSK